MSSGSGVFLVPKLCLGMHLRGQLHCPRKCPRARRRGSHPRTPPPAKHSFAPQGRSQTGVWERGDRCRARSSAGGLMGGAAPRAGHRQAARVTAGGGRSGRMVRFGRGVRAGNVTREGAGWAKAGSALARRDACSGGRLAKSPPSTVKKCCLIPNACCKVDGG